MMELSPSIVGILVSLFSGAISSALIIGSMKTDIQNMRESLREVSRKQDEHINFHLKK